jgi:hypothetical protein
MQPVPRSEDPEAEPARLVPVVVRTRPQDVRLLRALAGALNDPERRAQLAALVGPLPPMTKSEEFKALLARAPLEGVELDRSQDVGRDIDL